MKLKAILSGIEYQITGTQEREEEIEIVSLCDNSKNVTTESLFVAVKGLQVDGHQFINTAIEKGAKTIMCEQLPAEIKPNICYIKTPDTAKALGKAASNFYQNPSHHLKLIGVTGTNGKTTTVTLLYRLFQKLGHRSGLLSTVENRIQDEILPSTYTTPDAITINKLLKQMEEKNCEYVFMEVSSHAIIQKRTEGLLFSGAVFTNITHDHLDYHKTFEAYIKAKKMLFDSLPKTAFALVNSDDKNSNIMLQNCNAIKKSFSMKNKSDFKGKILHNTINGLELEINGKNAWFQLIGSFNAYNLLGVYGTAILLQQNPHEALLNLTSLQAPKGRYQQITSRTGIHIIIDYAHTPDGLEKILQTIQKLRSHNQNIITITGCGGNRDATKRPIMASIAYKYSHTLILTSDNPRFENPMDIINQMLKGIHKNTKHKKVLVIPERKEAIETTINSAQKGDIILLAGKGHEEYQDIQGIKHPFNEYEIVNNILRNKQ
ncbi:MAG: UDP-N-acetylmuramoyl-L-alanyl-D-glutamate--2,6-diaminopimelate ligase [Chitinophagaceae bacterium]|nr:UDP-N-acetylmuramoyl-L-alanyl-D-glutamate--2,6-diaminopimelate ligase [Chitinophagaceae bacterium]